MNQATSLTLTYDSFANLWNALVSRRKAKRLDIDKDEAWAQLHAQGIDAPFLRADAARQEAKKTKKTADQAKKTGNKRKGHDDAAEAVTKKSAKSLAKGGNGGKGGTMKTVTKRSANRGKTAASSKPSPGQGKK